MRERERVHDTRCEKKDMDMNSEQEGETEDGEREYMIRDAKKRIWI